MGGGGGEALLSWQPVMATSKTLVVSVEPDWGSNSQPDWWLQDVEGLPTATVPL